MSLIEHAISRLDIFPPNFFSPGDGAALNTTFPFFTEIRDPVRPCFGFICLPGSSGSESGLDYIWVERFSAHRCCRFESQASFHKTLKTDKLIIHLQPNFNWLS